MNCVESESYRIYSPIYEILYQTAKGAENAKESDESRSSAVTSCHGRLYGYCVLDRWINLSNWSLVFTIFATFVPVHPLVRNFITTIDILY
jgi:hypothetical protein